MSFQTMSTIVYVTLAITAVFVGLVFISYPVLAVVSVVGLANRRKRNWRDRWARQRTLNQTVASVAVSSHTAGAPPTEEYPVPEGPGTDDAAVSVLDTGAPSVSVSDYPNPGDV